jgi:hypothetical protein
VTLGREWAPRFRPIGLINIYHHTSLVPFVPRLPPSGRDDTHSGQSSLFRAHSGADGIYNFDGDDAADGELRLLTARLFSQAKRRKSDRHARPVVEHADTTMLDPQRDDATAAIAQREGERWRHRRMRRQLLNMASSESTAAGIAVRSIADLANASRATVKANRHETHRAIMRRTLLSSSSSARRHHHGVGSLSLDATPSDSDDGNKTEHGLDHSRAQAHAALKAVPRCHIFVIVTTRGRGCVYLEPWLGQEARQRIARERADQKTEESRFLLMLDHHSPSIELHPLTSQASG